VGFTGNLPELQTAAAGGGFFDNPALDRDGVYRRVPLLQRYHGALYESFALALARLSLGSPRALLQLSFRRRRAA
jgi:adenylate cyclase